MSAPAAARPKTSLAKKPRVERKAKQKSDGHGEHDQVVHIDVRRREQRAGGERRGLEIERRAAAPEPDQRRGKREAQRRLNAPGERLAAAMRADQAEHALQPAEVGMAFAEHDAARDRHPMREGLPARAAESEPRQRGKPDRRRRGNHDGQPAPVRDQHQGKQQTELRLVGEQPETNAGKRRPPLQQAERAADQRRGEEAVLPGGDVPERRGKAERDENSGAAENAPQRRDISGERRQQRQRSPRRQTAASPAPRRQTEKAADNASRNSRQNRGRWRGLPLAYASASRRRRPAAVEREPSRGDDIDEIVGDRPALRVEQKIAFEESAAEHDQITRNSVSPMSGSCALRKKAARRSADFAGQAFLGEVHAARPKQKTLAREL